MYFKKYEDCITSDVLNLVRIIVHLQVIWRVFHYVINVYVHDFTLSPFSKLSVYVQLVQTDE